MTTVMLDMNRLPYPTLYMNGTSPPSPRPAVALPPSRCSSSSAPAAKSAGAFKAPLLQIPTVENIADAKFPLGNQYSGIGGNTDVGVAVRLSRIYTVDNVAVIASRFLLL